MSDTTSSPDLFDRTLGSLDGLPGVVATGQATVQTTTPLLGNAETFIVQTIRHPEMGDTIFLQALSSGRSFRLVIPPKVAAVLSRQRDALTKRTRSRAARAAVVTKRERGQILGNPAALEKARKAKR
jgi:hypothetical protein